MSLFAMNRSDLILFVCFTAAVLAGPFLLAPIGAGYPDLLQKFAIFGIFALGFNILFGLTGYLSFGHAAFLGVGSYTAVHRGLDVQAFEHEPAAGDRAGDSDGRDLRSTDRLHLPQALGHLLLNPDPRICPDELQPRLFGADADHNGETGLQLNQSDPRVLDTLFGRDYGAVLPSSDLFGITMTGYPGFYFCAVILILCFLVTMRIFRSPFGMMLRAVKSNQNRMNYTGLNTRPYAMAAFVISGMFAGLAGGLMAVTDPLAGAERMQWTASGEVVLMTILGGSGTLLGPVIGAGAIKYFENIFSSFNEGILLRFFDFLPEALQHAVVSLTSLFVGEGWHLTLGALFMLIVIFLPGGLMEGFNRLRNWVVNRFGGGGSGSASQPATA